MTEFFHMMGFVCGAILLYRTGDAVLQMGLHTNHWIRVGQLCTCVGSLALVLSPMAPNDPHMQTFGLAAIVLGVTLKEFFDRRKPDGGQDGSTTQAQL